MKMEFDKMVQVLQDLSDQDHPVDFAESPAKDETYIYHARLLKQGGYILGHDHGHDGFRPIGLTSAGHQLLALCGEDDFGKTVTRIIREMHIPCTPEMVKRVGHRLVTERVQRYAVQNGWLTASDMTTEQ